MSRQKCLCSFINHEASWGMAFTITLFQNGTKWLFKVRISNQGLNTILTPHITPKPVSILPVFRRVASGHYYINYLQIEQAIFDWNHRASSHLFSISYWSPSRLSVRKIVTLHKSLTLGSFNLTAPCIWRPWLLIPPLQSSLICKAWPCMMTPS
jgi:hypothetical protein